jgi:beta-glucanase (GH16 family)
MLIRLIPSRTPVRAGAWSSSLSSRLPLLLLLLSAPTPSVQQCPTLLWSDEFDGTALDETKWTPQVGDGCDLGADLCGWGNAEGEYYRSENIEVSDGMLKIHARQEQYGSREYTSARIRSLGKYDVDMTSQTTARIRLEARIKVPPGNGLWSAFWMLNSQMELNTWPLGGELDIMECIGREPNNVRCC